MWRARICIPLVKWGHFCEAGTFWVVRTILKDRLKGWLEFKNQSLGPGSVNSGPHRGKSQNLCAKPSSNPKKRRIKLETSDSDEENSSNIIIIIIRETRSCTSESTGSDKQKGLFSSKLAQSSTGKSVQTGSKRSSDNVRGINQNCPSGTGTTSFTPPSKFDLTEIVLLLQGHNGSQSDFLAFKMHIHPTCCCYLLQEENKGHQRTNKN